MQESTKLYESKSGRHWIAGSSGKPPSGPTLPAAARTTDRPGTTSTGRSSLVPSGPQTTTSRPTTRATRGSTSSTAFRRQSWLSNQSRTSRPGLKSQSIAYYRLFHLVGDMQQPLHSTALYCDYFPDGDKGGSILRTKQMQNLHAIWDGWLGADDSPARVIRESEEFKRRRELWNVDTTATPEDWIAEGHELANSAVYTPDILETVGKAQPGSPLPPLVVSEEYLKAGGEIARRRIVEGGLWLGSLLHP